MASFSHSVLAVSMAPRRRLAPFRTSRPDRERNLLMVTPFPSPLVTAGTFVGVVIVGVTFDCVASLRFGRRVMSVSRWCRRQDGREKPECFSSCTIEVLLLRLKHKEQRQDALVSWFFLLDLECPSFCFSVYSIRLCHLHLYLIALQGYVFACSFSSSPSITVSPTNGLI